MTDKNKACRVRGLSGTATAVAMALASGTAAAQNTDESVEEIVVTGSRLVRRDFTAPSPITSIDRDTILSSGQPTLEETLNNLPQIQPDFGRASNNPGSGSAPINLRGIGAGRTLVMLNGRRVAPAGIGSAVDVNTLPGVLVERVEIITGGATTVYGSDAIAGVVNFITRDDFEGFGLETSYYTTEQGDADTFDITVTWGRNVGDGNVTLFGGYLDREPLFQAERDFSAQSIDDDVFAGMLIPGGSPTTPAGGIAFPQVDFGNGPARTIWDTNGDPREFIDPDDLYDYGPINYLQIPLERYTGGALFNYDLADNARFYSELMYTHNEVVQSLAPTGTFGSFVEINTDNPVLTPANAQFLANNAFPTGPGRVGFVLARRLSELGPRISKSESDYTRLLAGLRGELTATWDYDAWVSYTKSETSVLDRNDGSFSRLQQGLLVDPVTGACFDPSNGCVPLNLFGEGNLSAAGADFIRAAPYVTDVEREQILVSAFVRGEPIELPAGDLSMAIGAEWREDSGNATADPALFTGDTLGFSATSNVVGDESVSEIYAEMLVPLLDDVPLARYLGVEIGGRLSNYKNAGELETWKLGADWEPFAGVRFRTMLQRSARAPNIGEAFQLPFERPFQVIGQDPRQDPCSASADPVGNGFEDICIAQGIPPSQIGVFEAAPGSQALGTSGGNPDLVPETAETFTAGVVLTPFDSLTLALDYFEIDVEDTIGGADPLLVCWDPVNTERITCDRIGRDPQSFNINAVDFTNANLGKVRSAGFDTQINFSTELSGWLAPGGYADLDVTIIWTHTTRNSFQADPAASSLDYVGKFGPLNRFLGTDSLFPEDRVTTNIAWRGKSLSARLGWQWIGGTENSATEALPLFGVPAEIVNPAIQTLGSKSYVDLSIGYEVTENVSLNFTIANLLDEDPAFMANHGSQANTDTEMYDVFGRAYTLRFSLNY